MCEMFRFVSTRGAMRHWQFSKGRASYIVTHVLPIVSVTAALGSTFSTLMSVSSNCLSSCLHILELVGCMGCRSRYGRSHLLESCGTPSTTTLRRVCVSKKFVARPTFRGKIREGIVKAHLAHQHRSGPKQFEGSRSSCVGYCFMCGS